MHTNAELPPLPDIEPDVYEDWWYEAGRYSWQVSGRPEEVPSLAMPFTMMLVQIEPILREVVERDTFLLDLARTLFTRGWKDRKTFPQYA